MNVDLSQTGDDYPPLTPIESEALSSAQELGKSEVLSVAQPGPWRYKDLAAAGLFSFVMQNLFLPCMCAAGDAKMIYAFCFDGLIVVRVLCAWLFREKGNGWKFYAWLLYLSPLWIWVMVETFFRYYH